MGKRRRSRPEDSPWQVCVIGSRAGDNAFTLSSLKGAPRRVDWDFEVFGWKELDNLDGLPEYVKGDVGLRCPAGPAGHPASGPAAGDADGKIKPLFTDGIRRRFLSLDIHCDPGRSEIPQGSTPAPRRHDAPGGVDAA